MPKSFSIAAVPDALFPLVAQLESLDSRASIDDLSRWLAQLEISLSDLSKFVHFGETYRRNLICEGQFYEVLCICWASGQRSPIHNHAGSTCGLRVMEGTATETVFRSSPCGQKLPVRSVDLVAPLVTASQDEDTHQVSNLQPEGCDLVTLHIYSPPLRMMDKFSITGEPAGIYRPRNIEFAYGGGI